LLFYIYFVKRRDFTRIRRHDFPPTLLRSSHDMTRCKSMGLLVSKSTAKENTTLRPCQLLERPNCKPQTQNFFLANHRIRDFLRELFTIHEAKIKQMNNIIVS
jgi:hypothetical protein